MAALLVGMLVPVSLVYAQNQSIANNEMVGQFIVKLKPVDEGTNNVQSYALSASPSKKPLEKLRLVIDRVEKARKEKRGHLLKSQKNAVQEVVMHAEKAIDDNTMVISLDKAVSRSTAEQLMQEIAKDKAVEYVEPDLRVSHFRQPDDTDYHQQWGYFNETGGANLPVAWDETQGSAEIVVAVIDTGYLPHADLQGNLLPGYDFISDPDTANRGFVPSYDGRDFGDWVTTKEATDPDPLNPFYGCGAGASSWHGSHVAGTIGAVSDNRMGVSGMSWKGKILPVRVLGKCGGSLSDVVAGMRWAAGLPVANVPANTHPARVLNLSLGVNANQCSLSFADAVRDIKNNGVTIVVAAGNSAINVAGSMPANCAGVIAVAATDVAGKLAWFSNRGSGITISAPGVNILSTTNNGPESPSPTGDNYQAYQGTSMAAPHVAGTIALMLAVNPQLTSEQILQILQSSARAFPAESNCSTTLCGAGLLDAGEAVKQAKP